MSNICEQNLTPFFKPDLKRSKNHEKTTPFRGFVARHRLSVPYWLFAGSLDQSGLNRYFDEKSTIDHFASEALIVRHSRIKLIAF